MTLTFLGQVYEANTTEMAPTPSTMTGLYRGVPVKFSQTHLASRSYIAMNYRGIRYVG